MIDQRSILLLLDRLKLHTTAHLFITILYIKRTAHLNLIVFPYAIIWVLLFFVLLLGSLSHSFTNLGGDVRISVCFSLALVTLGLCV